METRVSRRRLLGMMGAAAAASVLGACAPKVVTQEVEKVVKETVVTKETVQVVATQAPGQKRSLLVHWLASQGETQQVMDTLFTEFGDEHPGVEMQVVYTPHAEYDRKTDLLIAAGTPPCIWGPLANRGGRHYAARNLLMVLDPFVERDGYDFSDFFPGTLQLCKWQDHWVGLPKDLWPSTMVYNKSIFEEAGVEEPSKDWNDKEWNWDTCLEAARAMTKVEGGKVTQFGMGSVAPDRMSFRHFGQSYFAREDFDVGYPAKFGGTGPEFVDALRFMYNMVGEWGVAPTPAQLEALAAGANIFATSKLGINVSYPWDLGWLAQVEEFDWDLAPMPSPRFLGHDLPRFNFMFPDQYFAMRGCLAPDDAWELIKMMASPEVQRLLSEKFGSMPARKSVAETVYVEQKMQQTGKPKETIQVILDAAAVETASESHCFVHFAELWEKGIQPYFEQVFVGQLTPEQAVVQMEQACNRIIEETGPED